ncbi:MAG: SGNH/GDSL hydrolase family protein [Planctomycetota bacterium]
MVDLGAESRRPRTLGRRRKLLFSVLVIAVFLVLLELGFRSLEVSLGLPARRIEKAQAYARHPSFYFNEPHPYTLYTRNRSLSGVSSLGFRERELQIEKAPGVVRIACLGGSTTWGSNSLGRLGAYPHYLEKALQERFGEAYEVANWGMPGWLSSESMINYFLKVQDFAPDIVIIHHAVNDVVARNRPGFRRDYSHHRQPWTDRPLGWVNRTLASFSHLYCWILLETGTVRLDVEAWVDRPETGRSVFEASGELSLETAEPYRRNIRTICEHVRLRGGVPVLLTMPVRPGTPDDWLRQGIEQHNQILRQLEGDDVAVLVDLAERVKSSARDLEPHFSDIVHMRPYGHRLKALFLLEALVAADVLP